MFERGGVGVLPDDLALLPPGPALGFLLGGVDRSGLDDGDLIGLAQARQRLISHLQAQLLADLHAVGRRCDAAVGDRSPSSGRWAEVEVAFAMRWTGRAAAGQLGLADDLVDRLPNVFAALDAGEIDAPRARVFADVTCGLDVLVARRVADQVLDQAGRWTTGQVRARLQRLVLAADPEAAMRKAAQAVAGRRVQARLTDVGAGELCGYDLPPHRVAAAMERLSAIARAAKNDGDLRKMDQLRADAFLDLLVGDGIAVGDPVTAGGLAPDSELGSNASLGSDSELHPDGGLASEGGLDFGGEADFSCEVGPDGALDPDGECGPDHELGADGERGPDGEFGSDGPRPDDAAGCSGLPAIPQRRSRAEDPAPVLAPGMGEGGGRKRPVTGQGWAGDGVGGRCGALPGPRRGVIDLQIPLLTLMGLADLPGDLAGWGPVVADIARQVAAQQQDATWRYSVYDQLGELAAHGITRRRPTAEDAAFIKARDRTCRAPGCRMPAKLCDIDHTNNWASSKDNRRDNLATLCVRHHLFKHLDSSDLTQITPGVLGWKTPLGQRYVTTPTPYPDDIG